MHQSQKGRVGFCILKTKGVFDDIGRAKNSSESVVTKETYFKVYCIAVSDNRERIQNGKRV
jgi:hypothetical protein